MNIVTATVSVRSIWTLHECAELCHRRMAAVSVTKIVSTECGLALPAMFARRVVVDSPVCRHVRKTDSAAGARTTVHASTASASVLMDSLEFLVIKLVPEETLIHVASTRVPALVTMVVSALACARAIQAFSA